MDEHDSTSPEQEIDFCTLGMFIVGKVVMCSPCLSHLFFSYVLYDPITQTSLAIFDFNFLVDYPVSISLLGSESLVVSGD